jgi:predicted phage terminase large subunit-like protein
MPNLSREQIRKFKNNRELLRRKAKTDLLSFAMYNNFNYKPQPYHRYIASRLTDFLTSETCNKMMIMLPPQHGKSELVSRNFPAFAHGLFPALKIVGVSFSGGPGSVASMNNYAIQRIMKGEYYHDVFPDSVINRGNEFGYNILGHKENYKGVGILGGLTGHGVDVGIIDDPTKDNMEAQSKVYRDRAWEWYLKVFLTRLHNRSKQLIIMTRWHEDDLCGRILRAEPNEWEVIIFRAIREDEIVPYDIRPVGTALWEDMHSLAKLYKMQSISLTTFNSLHQQRPRALEGNIFKKHWFRTFQMSEIQGLLVCFVIDSAYTKSTKNDPSVILAYTIKGNCLYIINVRVVRMEFPDLLREISNQVRLFGSSRSIVWVEPKASGKSIVQEMRERTGLNITEDHIPETDKETRAHSVAPFCEGGRVLVLENADWLDDYFEELTTFPNAPHDDQVDVTIMAIKKIVNDIYSAYGGGVII